LNALLAPHGVPHRLRPMTVLDLEAVMAVERAAYGHPWTRGNFVDSLAAGYVAEVMLQTDGQLLGYFVALPGVEEMHLLNITIAVAEQGQGLGGLLLDVLEQRARAHGARMLWLEVRAGNLRARRLYERRGFRQVGLRRGYYPAGLARREDAVVMSLSLDPGGGADAVV
jgi:ribosomal-protein-alanine N-acetyltransferase